MTTHPAVPGPLLLAGGNAWTGMGLDAVIDACGGGEVLVIPTAAAFEGTAAAVDHVCTLFASTTAVMELHVSQRHDALDEALAARVGAASLIVLPGESSLHARSVLKGTPVWEAVLAAWGAGAAIVGIGGGAAMLCDPMVDARGGAFTIGLGLVPHTALLAHADGWGDERMKRTVRLVSRGVALVAVDDDSAVCWLASRGWTAHGHIAVRRDGATVECSTIATPEPPTD